VKNAKINIRAAKRSDAEEIGGMALDFAAYLRALGDKTTFRFNARAYLRDGWGRNPAFKGLVAEVDGHCVGYLLYHFGYDTDRAIRILFMADLYVREGQRRLGIGRALMARASQVCAKAGAKRLVWSIHINNSNARGFYRHMGARHTYARDTLYMYLPVK